MNTKRLLIAVLPAAALIVAACAGGGGDADGATGETAAPTAAPAASEPPPGPEPATEPDSDPAVEPEVDAESGVEAVSEAEDSPAVEPEDAAAATPDDSAATTPDGGDDGAAADPFQAFFDLDRVLDISIDIATEDWDTLRTQTRTFEDLMAEIEEYELSRPFAGIYSWFSATVTVDGETHSEVGVRKKGFIGSQSETKPSLKLRFDKYIDDQSLGGVVERMTLNNSIQDPSFLNTCLAYRIFATAGNPASRCNFATVTVNGKNLGLYVHVEELKKPFLLRHFGTAEGNLYEGTVSDFDPVYRGTIEKKNNEDADDWSDVDAVMAALADPSDAGLVALAEIVDLDRFLTFWATEVLIGHWDGYAGDRNNFWFYRVPDGKFVFLPWGPDGTFHLDDDPNPFDDISNPPPSVLALTAIPNRLYNTPVWRAAYVERLKEIIFSVWNEAELLAVVDEMAALVAEHALPEERKEAADDTERVRKFVLKRRGEILADLTPTPPEWPEPEVNLAEDLTDSRTTLEVAFETVWGSSVSLNPAAVGRVTSLLLDGLPESVETVIVTAGHSTPDEALLLPNRDKTASLLVADIAADGTVTGMVLVIALEEVTSGATLVIGRDAIAGGVFTIPPGAAAPDSFTLLSEGTLELSSAGTTPGDPVVGSFAGTFGGTAAPPDADEDSSAAGADVGLVINELAARGEPFDWFELHNTSSAPINLDGFLVADDLTDVGKRVAFPAGTVLEPGAYMVFELDKEAWPGFALGGDEELGIWLADGTLIDSVDWNEGDSPEAQSYARTPNATGEFQTTTTPTRSAPNHP